MSKHKICLVPTCPNTRRNSPDKTFVYVPDHVRSRWCMEYNFEYVPKHCFCCEDHLDFREDLANYTTWKLVNAKPVLKSTANLLLNSSVTDNGHSDDSDKYSLHDPHRLIYIKNFDATKLHKPFIESTMRSENTVNVSLQSKVQTMNRSTHKAQKQRSIKPRQASPSRPRRQLVENPEPTILSSSKSNQTFVISPLRSINTISIEVQCKAETEERGTTGEITREQSVRSWASVIQADASLQCTLVAADDGLVKPRKSRFSKSGMKRYDLVTDQRKIVPRIMQTVQTTSIMANQSTSGTQKSRWSRLSTKTDQLTQDQGISRTPKNTASVTSQLKLRLLTADSTSELQTPIETEPQPSTSKTASNILRLRNTIVCETEKHRICRSDMPHDAGTQKRHRPLKNTDHVSLQVGSRKTLVRSPVVSKAKGMSSPSFFDRYKINGRRAYSNRIVIRIPKSSYHNHMHSRDTEEI